MTPAAILETHAGGLPCRRGKVRDVYDLGDRLLLVATDRISAFDWVLPNGIPDKGRVLTQLVAVLVRPVACAASPALHATSPISRRPFAARRRSSRAAACSAARPRSCRSSASCAATWPARGWKEYQRTGTVCGIALPAGLTRARPPARADLHPRHQGRDRSRREHPVRDDGDASSARSWPRTCSDRTLDVYQRARPRTPRGAASSSPTRNSSSATPDGELLLIDEVLTPDSSPLLAGRRLRSPAAASRRSTSSSCAIGWKASAATNAPRRRRCLRKSSPAPATSIGKPCDDSAGFDRSAERRARELHGFFRRRCAPRLLAS